MEGRRISIWVSPDFLDEYEDLKKMLNVGFPFDARCASGIACGIFDKIKHSQYPFPWNFCFDNIGNVRIKLDNLKNCISNFEEVRRATRGVSEHLLIKAIIMCRLIREEYTVEITRVGIDGKPIYLSSEIPG